MPARRVCGQSGCPVLVDKGEGKCPEHRRTDDRTRGSRQQRGYDATYDRTRRAATRLIAAGGVTCWRCGDRIKPGDEWHLGHADNDRAVIKGPEHSRSCNLRAAGMAAHGRPFTPRDVTQRGDGGG